MVQTMVILRFGRALSKHYEDRSLHYEDRGLSLDEYEIMLPLRGLWAATKSIFSQP